MSLFDWLLVGHLVGDFLLQTDGMARYKAQSWTWMLRHVGLYLAVMVIVLGVYSLSNPVPLWVLGLSLLLIGATHIVLDRRGFTLAWMRPWVLRPISTGSSLSPTRCSTCWSWSLWSRL